MIKMIMALQIVNTQTAETIIPKALEAVGETELKRWPGTEIVVGSDNDAEAEAALALIGTSLVHRLLLALTLSRCAQRTRRWLLSSTTQKAARWRKFHLQDHDI